MKRGLSGAVGAVGLAFALTGGPAAASGPAAAMNADQLILQFKRPALQAALREAPQAPAARAAVRRELAVLGQRHGVALHYLQTLAVGSALVAVTPASAQPEGLRALVVRLAADAEVEAVEINARMTPFTPAAR